MTIYLSLLVALAGALLYAFSANTKLQTIGIVSYGCGLLAFLLGFAGHAVTLVH